MIDQWNSFADKNIGVDDSCEDNIDEVESHFKMLCRTPVLLEHIAIKTGFVIPKKYVEGDFNVVIPGTGGFEKFEIELPLGDSKLKQEL